jgi:hypothetical protein
LDYYHQYDTELPIVPENDTQTFSNGGKQQHDAGATTTSIFDTLDEYYIVIPVNVHHPKRPMNASKFLFHHSKHGPSHYTRTSSSKRENAWDDERTKYHETLSSSGRE